MTKGNLYLWLMKIALFCCFLLSIAYFFSTKYISTGECVSIVYYIPFQWSDYILLFLLGLSFGGLSITLPRKRQGKNSKIIEGVIYTIIIVLICYFANDILGSVEYDWPHKYSPTPYLGHSV